MKIGFYILFIAFSFINVLSANENSYYLILKNKKLMLDMDLGLIIQLTMFTKKKIYL